MSVETIDNGSITSPIGFTANGIHSGIKKEGLDMAVILSETKATCAGVYTRNIVKGHSLKLTIEHMKMPYAKCIFVNSGCANACLGQKGYDNINKAVTDFAEYIGEEPYAVLFGSTGVIGKALPDSSILLTGMKKAYETASKEGGIMAAEAIRTTDTHRKEYAVKTQVGGKTVTVAGCCKGSGMIHPNMGTMISVITTDAAIEKSILQEMLSDITGKTFNRVSVDGDTSVCDMCILMAGGKAENSVIKDKDSDYENLYEAVYTVAIQLSRMLARDGEGATKLIEIYVDNTKTRSDAYGIAVAIAKSPLCKTAFFGADANWGRIITAAGYSGVDFDTDKVDIYIGKVLTCKNGTAVDFSEEDALEELKKDDVVIRLDMHEGDKHDMMLTCDFSYDYVRINGSYRS